MFDVLQPVAAHLAVLVGDAASERGAPLIRETLQRFGNEAPRIVVVTAPQIGMLSPQPMPAGAALLTPEGGMVECARRLRALLDRLQSADASQSSLQELTDATSRKATAANATKPKSVSSIGTVAAKPPAVETQSGETTPAVVARAKPRPSPSNVDLQPSAADDPELVLEADEPPAPAAQAAVQPAEERRAAAVTPAAGVAKPAFAPAQNVTEPVQVPGAARPWGAKNVSTPVQAPAPAARGFVQTKDLSVPLQAAGATKNVSVPVQAPSAAVPRTARAKDVSAPVHAPGAPKSQTHDIDSLLRVAGAGEPRTARAKDVSAPLQPAGVAPEPRATRAKDVSVPVQAPGTASPGPAQPADANVPVPDTSVMARQKQQTLHGHAPVSIAALAAGGAVGVEVRLRTSTQSMKQVTPPSAAGPERPVAEQAEAQQPAPAVSKQSTSKFQAPTSRPNQSSSTFEAARAAQPKPPAAAPEAEFDLAFGEALEAIESNRPDSKLVASSDQVSTSMSLDADEPEIVVSMQPAMSLQPETIEIAAASIEPPVVSFSASPSRDSLEAPTPIAISIPASDEASMRPAAASRSRRSASRYVWTAVFVVVLGGGAALAMRMLQPGARQERTVAAFGTLEHAAAIAQVKPQPSAAPGAVALAQPAVAPAAGAVVPSTGAGAQREPSNAAHSAIAAAGPVATPPIEGAEPGLHDQANQDLAADPAVALPDAIAAKPASDDSPLAAVVAANTDDESPESDSADSTDDAVAPNPAVVRAERLADEGLGWIKEGRFGLAEASYLRSLRAFPSYPRALAGLVRVHIARQDGAEAVRWAKRLTKRQSSRAQNHLLLGDAQALRGDTKAARKAWTRAARLGSLTARSRLRSAKT
jgi:hypothetical protein